MQKIIITIAFIFFTAQASAQALADVLKPRVWHTYIFVTTKMPRANLITLAREASRTKAVLVFNGFEEEGGVAALQKKIAEINVLCCDKREVSWIIHPKLFERYRVKSAPTFVIAQEQGETPRTEDFVMVSGDMTLANALKFMAQESKVAVLKKRAGDVYGLF